MTRHCTEARVSPELLSSFLLVKRTALPTLSRVSVGATVENGPRFSLM
jgi:hypothetical protein